MFIADELTVAVSMMAARLRLANLLSGGWLDAASRAAYAEHGVTQARIGPARGMSRLVNVRHGDLRTRGDTSVLALRWEALGAGRSLFPVLDADLTLRPAGDNATLLRLDGAYRPPLGTLGAGLDRAVLHHVARATVKVFLGQVSDALAEPGPARAPEPGKSPLWPESLLWNTQNE